jgi:hypothetical protein
MKTSNVPTAILTVLEATQMPLTVHDVVGLLSAGLLPVTLRNANRHLLKLVDSGMVQRKYIYMNNGISHERGNPGGIPTGSYYYSLKGEPA